VVETVVAPIQVDVRPVNNPFVNVPFVPNKFVVVTLVAVPFAKVSMLSVVPPTTVSVEVTVELAPMNPPYSCSVVVANEPRAETEANVSVEPGQFAPLERQACWPATYKTVVETVPAPKTVVVT
jgi:hypothetical protein